MKTALSVDARLIGINNRNLHTFTVDNNNTINIIQTVPADRRGNIAIIALSGIQYVLLLSRCYSHPSLSDSLTLRLVLVYTYVRNGLIIELPGKSIACVKENDETLNSKHA